MRIACPKCGTRFEIAEAVLGTTGRKVQCARCAHIWHEQPEPAMATAAAMPMEAEPAPMMAPADDDWGAAAGEQPLLTPEIEDEPTDLNALSELLASQELGGGGSMDGVERLDDETDLGEADPLSGPIPEVLTRGTERGRGGYGTWKAILWAVVISFLAAGLLFGVAWLQRHEIVAMLPATAPAFRGLGMDVDPPPALPTFRDNPTFGRLRDGVSEKLVLSGEILNPHDKAVPIPKLRLVVFDRDDQALAQETRDPPKPEIKPGETVAFSLTLSDLPKTAHHTRVEFIAAGNGGEGREVTHDQGPEQGEAPTTADKPKTDEAKH